MHVYVHVRIYHGRIQHKTILVCEKTSKKMWFLTIGSSSQSTHLFYYHFIHNYVKFDYSNIYKIVKDVRVPNLFGNDLKF